MTLERPAEAEHGDYATNVALRLAPVQKRSPRELGEELAAAGDQPSPDLQRAVNDRAALVMNYTSFACLVAILVLMVFKPGAG